MKTACVNNVVKRSCQIIPSHFLYWMELAFYFLRFSQLLI